MVRAKREPMFQNAGENAILKKPCETSALFSKKRAGNARHPKIEKTQIANRVDESASTTRNHREVCQLFLSKKAKCERGDKKTKMWRQPRAFFVRMVRAVC